MSNLYVVESPLQALCALEVSLGKKDEKNSIIIRLSDSNRSQNNKQILNVVKLGEWDEIITFRPDEFNSKIFTHISKLSKIKNKFNSNVESLYIGEFRYSFMHMIRSAVNAPNVYLLDDGAATVKVIENYIKNNQYHPDLDAFLPNNICKKLAYKIIYGKYLNNKTLKNKINVLTAFAEKDSNHNISELKFDNIRQLYRGHKSTNNQVYFYGSPYSEAGIVSLSYELNFLSLIKKFYEDKSLHIVYFPHRDESEEKLQFLQKKLGFTLKRNQEMAELQLLKSNILPREIAGAYTSTLNNLRCIYPKLKVTSFKLDMNKINETYREEINNIYQYYSSIGVSIESFD